LSPIDDGNIGDHISDRDCNTASRHHHRIQLR
jgi:hypothetical protein